MERIISVILSSCTLHEFCLDNSDSGDEYIPEGERDEEEINNFQYAFGVPLSAELKRESISVLLNNHNRCDLVITMCTKIKLLDQIYQ